MAKYNLIKVTGMSISNQNHLVSKQILHKYTQFQSKNYLQCIGDMKNTHSLYIENPQKIKWNISLKVQQQTASFVQ